MGTKYVIKLKGIDCYLKNSSEKTGDFTFDITKAKVFDSEKQENDIISKLVASNYRPERKGACVDFIRLTMDKRTWQEMYDDNFEQLRLLSDSRRTIHSYSFSLEKQLETKVKSFSRSAEFPNFEAQYYGEDFERFYSIR